MAVAAPASANPVPFDFEGLAMAIAFLALIELVVVVTEAAVLWRALQTGFLMSFGMSLAANAASVCVGGSMPMFDAAEGSRAIYILAMLAIAVCVETPVLLILALRRWWRVAPPLAGETQTLIGKAFVKRLIAASILANFLTGVPLQLLRTG